MAWKIEIDGKAKKAFEKIDKVNQKKIDNYLMRLLQIPNPQQYGQAIQGPFKIHLAGGYRFICKIEDFVLTILVIQALPR